MSLRALAVTSLIGVFIPEAPAQQPVGTVQPSATDAATSRFLSSNRQIVWYSRNGKREPSFIEPGVYTQIELSPNGRYLAVERGKGGPGESPRYDLWLADLSSKTFTRWTDNSDNPRDPVWSPDSRSIAYRVASEGKRQLRKASIGSSAETTLYESAVINFPDDWTPDGKFLLVHTDKPDTVALLPASGGEPRSVLETSGRRNDMRVSPDNKWIAYGMDESGKFEIHVAAFPSFANSRKITGSAGVQVRWRRDGKELYYLTSDGKMTAQPFDPRSGRETGAPRVLFQTAARPAFEVYFYSVSAKGDRFLVVESAPARPAKN